VLEASPSVETFNRTSAYEFRWLAPDLQMTGAAMRMLHLPLLLLMGAAHADLWMEVAPYQPFSKMAGIKITVQSPKNPFVKAGAMKGDVITQVNGRDLGSRDDVKWAALQKHIEEMIIIRADRTISVRPEVKK
jgi:hypothetical protein